MLSGFVIHVLNNEMCDIEIHLDNGFIINIIKFFGYWPGGYRQVHLSNLGRPPVTTGQCLVSYWIG